MQKSAEQNPLISFPLKRSSTSSPGENDMMHLISASSSPPLHLPTMISSQSSPPPPRNFISPHQTETNEVVVYPSSVSLKVCINKKEFFFFLGPTQNFSFFLH